MPKHIEKFSRQPREFFRDRHRFEHWYVANQIYFITARCRDRYAAFASDEAKAIFWDRFEHHTRKAGFVCWIVSLLDNHYHMLGYAPKAETTKKLMPRLHGSTAKLVNDLLPQRHKPFWLSGRQHDYFDGCIRDEKQLRRAYRYTQIQSQRHRVVTDWRTYPHTRAYVDLETCAKFAREQGAYMEDVPYARYSRDSLK